MQQSSIREDLIRVRAEHSAAKRESRLSLIVGLLAIGAIIYTFLRLAEIFG